MWYTKYVLNIFVCKDTCDPICYNTNTTTLWSLLQVWMTLMFTQGHIVTEKLELCSHSVVKSHDATLVFVVFDYIREATVKKSCEYVKYG